MMIMTIYREDDKLGVVIWLNRIEVRSLKSKHKSNKTQKLDNASKYQRYLTK